MFENQLSLNFYDIALKCKGSLLHGHFKERDYTGDMDDIRERFSDEEFFGRHLNLHIHGMEKVAQAVEEANYPAARQEYAQYLRKHIKREGYLSIPYEAPGNDIVLEGETEAAAAERICNNCLVSCGIPHSFGNQIDWHLNATPDGYSEWTWQINRHNEWKLLAHIYLQTGEERYAQKCAELFKSWVEQAGVPEITVRDAERRKTQCWRTIECGIRMGQNWSYALHAFVQSAAFTDDILIAWVKSVCEHGILLRRYHRDMGNWLIMEMNGLAQISMFFPELAQANEWREYAFRQLEKELTRQIYPDGFQIELSTNYQEVVLSNYCQLIKVAQAYNIFVPQIFFEKLETAAGIYVKLVMPDGRLPDLNDGCSLPASKFLEQKLVLFPGRKDFQWICTRGNKGKPPNFKSVALPYAGIMVMRSGWGADAVWGLLDAGPFGCGHQHEDKLSLLVFARGKLLLTEAGNYAYDQSGMREYVQSTRAHNTIRVDGRDQNRRKNYRWEEADISCLSSMVCHTGEMFDFAEGVYTEGYGANCECTVKHKRSVYFMKKIKEAEITPFFLVVDRLYSETEHDYEVLWHLEGETVKLTHGKAEIAGLRLLYSEAVKKAEVVYGQTEPEWQGWIANSCKQGDYRPVNTVKWFSHGASQRIVTALDPFCQIEAMHAAQGADATKIELRLEDGGCFVLDEKASEV